MKNLFYTATIAMIIGWLSAIDGGMSMQEWQYYMEGISIYLAIIFVTLVEAGNNFLKDK